LIANRGRLFKALKTKSRYKVTALVNLKSTHTHSNCHLQFADFTVNQNEVIFFDEDDLNAAAFVLPDGTK